MCSRSVLGRCGAIRLGVVRCVFFFLWCGLVWFRFGLVFDWVDFVCLILFGLGWFGLVWSSVVWFCGLLRAGLGWDCLFVWL